MLSTLSLLLSVRFLVISPAEAYPSYYATESIGGLVSDKGVLAQRRRIDEMTAHQLGASAVLFSKFSSPTANVSLACPAEGLVFPQDPNTPFQLVCQLTYSTLVPLALSSDIDIHQIAFLPHQHWTYLAEVGEDVESVQVNFPIQRVRMGSTYLIVWIREALPGGVDRSVHPWKMGNATLEADYAKWVKNDTTAAVTTTLGFHLKVLRPRGVLEVVFRILVAVLVCAITFVMGCELDGRKIWMHLKKPVGPVIGFVCQFGLMPLVSGHPLSTIIRRLMCEARRER